MPFLCRLPKNNELRERWIKKISENQNFEPTGFIICEKHFDHDSFSLKRKNGGGTYGMLKDDAIPSIFPMMPETNSDGLVRPTLTTAPIIGCYNTCDIKYCCNSLETNKNKILSFR